MSSAKRASLQCHMKLWMRHYGNTPCRSSLFLFLVNHIHHNIPCRFRRKRFNWPEIDPFEWESGLKSDGESEEQMRHCTLPEIQTTDGLTPVRSFEIFEVIKAS